MKITVGLATIEVTPADDLNQVQRLIQVLEKLPINESASDNLRHIAPIPQVKQLQRVAYAHGPRMNSNTACLRSTQYEMWSYLVDNDTSYGVHRSAVSRHFSIQEDTAGQRLSRMVATGTVVRIAAGFYRAAEMMDTDQASIKAVR